MSLGHIFLIYGGNAEERIPHRDRLVEEYSPKYPYWTESCDSENGNTAIVFGTTSNDVWSIGLRDIYDSVMGENRSESGNPSCLPVVQKVEAKENAGGISCKGPAVHVMTFGFSRYP